MGMMRKFALAVLLLCCVCCGALAVEGEWIVREEVELGWGELRWFDDALLRDAEPKGKTEWHSTNTAAAAVDRWGNVQAAKPESLQTTYIVAERGGVSYSWKVTVRPLVQQIQLMNGDVPLDGAVLDLDAGETQLTVRAEVLPAGSSPQVELSVKGEGATLSEDGTLAVSRDGSFTVTARARDRSRAQAECTVYAVHPVRSVTISGPAQLTSGEIISLSAQIEPQNATERRLEWQSSDESVLKVDQNGNVKALQTDRICTATVSASAVDGSGSFGEYTITVVPAAQKVDILYNGRSFPAQTLALDDSFVGTVLEMRSVVSPEQALQGVKWSSSNTSIIKVDSNGSIGVVGSGECRITAEAADGSGSKRVLHVVVGNMDKYPYYLEVDKGNQVVRAYGKDESGLYTVLVRRMICSTGRHENSVANGLYKVDSTRRRWMSTVIEGVYCQYGTRFTDQIWFHSLPYQGTDPAKMDAQAYAQLGKPVSHGCIRLLAADAKWIYENVPGGCPMLLCKCESTQEEYGSVHKPDAPGRWDPTDDNPENPHYDPTYTSAVLSDEFAPENRQKH